jgi:hypothetical protein
MEWHMSIKTAPTADAAARIAHALGDTQFVWDNLIYDVVVQAGSPRAVLRKQPLSPGQSDSVSKDTNPKQAFGDAKVPTHVIPKPALYWAALAHAHGALKYGAHNWRVSGVKATTYINAAKRHLDLFEEGQDIDAESGLPHLAHVVACMNILMDAQMRGKVQDDRPVSCSDDWLEQITAVWETLRSKYPDPAEPCTEKNRDA